MIVKDYFDAKKIFKPEDEVWACAFKYQHSKEGKRFFQKPVLGRLMCGNTLEKHLNCIRDCRCYLNYFVPYKKNSNQLAWSRAVEIYSRMYATSEAECIQLYNSMIAENINWHTKAIEELRKEFV